MSAKIFHIPFIKLTPQFKLYGIVQRTPRPGSSAPEDHPNLKHYSNAKDLFSDKEVHVVVITTPPDSHFELTKTALESGKHVLTEKPFVPTRAEARKLIEIARDNKRLLCVFQNRRWDADFLMVQHLLKEGLLGRVVELISRFDRYKPESPTNWKRDLTVDAGAGVIYDLGTHLMDQAYVLFGMPTAVQGRLLSQRRGGIDLENPDSASVQLVYPGGLLVNLGMSVMAVEPDGFRFWVRGTSGSFQKHGIDLQEPQLKAGMQPTDVGFGRDEPHQLKLLVVKEGRVEEEKVPDLQPETYTAFYRQWGKAVESEREDEVPVPASQAYDVLKIIEAVLESAKAGRDVGV